jgi:hypothetical protein
MFDMIQFTKLLVRVSIKDFEDAAVSIVHGIVVSRNQQANRISSSYDQVMRDLQIVGQNSIGLFDTDMTVKIYLHSMFSLYEANRLQLAYRQRLKRFHILVAAS